MDNREAGAKKYGPPHRNFEPIATIYGPPPGFDERRRERERYTLVSDLGGVLIDIDVRRCAEAFAKLIGEQNVNAVLGLGSDGEGLSSAATKQLMRDYELGYITTDEFESQILSFCPEGTTREQVTQAWLSMLCDIPGERFRILRDLKNRYNFRLLLLSNTNELHWQAIDSRYRLSDIFDKVFLSYEMHIAKPDGEIYRTVDAQAQVNPLRTFFVDDLSINRSRAERYVGWRTAESLEQLREQIENNPLFLH